MGERVFGAGNCQMIDMITEATIAYLSRQIDAGAEVVQLFDTWANALPETAFTRWCIEPTQRIVAALRETHPNVPVIGFPRGVGVALTDYAARTGVQGIGLDSAVPAAWARQEIQFQCTVQGNLDPLMVVAGGTAMTNEVRRITATLNNGPFVFNLGHGILPHTPLDHVAELVATVRSLG